MIFTSHLFLFYFLPLALVLNYSLPFRYLSLALVLLSYTFYGWANPPWVLLMLASSYVDYFCGLGLVRFSGLPPAIRRGLPRLPAGPRTRAQKLLLAVSICSNLALLGYFKYRDFAIGSVISAMGSLGLGHMDFRPLGLLLPVGISFYTFQSMSYAIDVYRGDARALKNPIDFQCFVANFPHLVAGPIVRYQTMDQQLRSRTFSYDKFARGVSFFCLGMAKKVLLANPLGSVADYAFHASVLHPLDAWFGLVSYAFQIYFDFAGYSDMAVGLGLMIGFYFVQNFDAPYSARSITDFWRRWHISLSTWLRDYVYVPLGGNRKGTGRTYVNLMTVMLFGGLWHGASWNFAIWGGLHGAALVAEKVWRRAVPSAAAPQWASAPLTFAFVCIGWVFFRADTVPDALLYVRSLFGAAPLQASADLVSGLFYTPYHLLVFVTAAVAVWARSQSWTYTQRLTAPRVCLCLMAFLASIVGMWTETANPFLYFQF